MAEASAEEAIARAISPNCDTVDLARRKSLYRLRGTPSSHGSTLEALPSVAALAAPQLLPPLHEVNVLAGAGCAPRGRRNFCGVSTATLGPGSRPVGTRDAKQGVMCGRAVAWADSAQVSDHFVPRGSGTKGAMFSCIC